MIQIRLRLYLTQTLEQRNHAFRVSGLTSQFSTLQFLPNYGLPLTPLLNDKLWALCSIVLTLKFSPVQKTLVRTESTCSLEHSLPSVPFLTLVCTRTWLTFNKQVVSNSSIEFWKLNSLETRVFKKVLQSTFWKSGVKEGKDQSAK